MINIDEMTRNDDIRNILKGYTQSTQLINQVITYMNHHLSDNVRTTRTKTYSLTLIRKIESIVIRLELFDGDCIKISEIRNEISHAILQQAK